MRPSRCYVILVLVMAMAQVQIWPGLRSLRNADVNKSHTLSALQQFSYTCIYNMTGIVC